MGAEQRLARSTLVDVGAIDVDGEWKPTTAHNPETNMAAFVGPWSFVAIPKFAGGKPRNGALEDFSWL